jgi:uncharacterized protein YkwD
MILRPLILVSALAGAWPGAVTAAEKSAEKSAQRAEKSAEKGAERAESFVQQLAALINDYRRQQGLQALLPAAELVSLADEHSEAMASQRVLTHEGFRHRHARSGSKVCVENLGWNHRSPQALLEGWRQSPGHHRNLLNPKVERVGIAARERFVTFFACR